MNEQDRVELLEVQRMVDRLETGQDEILRLLRGPLDDPSKGLVASVHRQGVQLTNLQDELSRVSSVSHAAPCPFLAGTENELDEHLIAVKKDKQDKIDRKLKVSDRIWDVAKPLLVQLFGAILGGSVITWLLSIMAG